MRISPDRPLGLAAATPLDYRELARRRLPRQLFDYIDGGAYEEATMRANVGDLEKLLLRQVVLKDVSVRDQSTVVAGQSLAMPVILGGLYPSATPGVPYSDPASFLAEVYRHGAGSSFDAVGAHPYPAGPPWVQGVMDLLKPLRSVMTANGDGSKDVWATEFGAPTNGPGAIATYSNRNYTQHPDHVDADLQARTVDAGIAAAKQLPWLRMLLWYSVQDLGTGNASNVTSYGLLNPDGTAKPAYAHWRAGFQSLAS